MAAATGYLAAVDPSRPGHYPGCPFLALTGWYCPGCGGLRALHHLTRGDLPAALSSNPVVVLAVPVALWFWTRWLVRSGRPHRASRESVTESLPSVPGADPKGRVRAGSRVWGPATLALGLILFAVLRNLPGLEVLAP